MNDESPDNVTQSETPNQPVANPREEAMAAIERQNNERIAKELGLKVEDVAGPETVSADPDADPDEAVAEAERQRLAREAEAAERQAQVDKQLDADKDTGKAAVKPTSEPTVLENFDNLMVKTKVDGQEIVRPLAELVRIEQKEAAATQRLKQAVQMREEAERLLAEARKTPPQDSKAPSTAQPEPASPLAKEFLDAIYSGEEDKALQAFSKLFGNQGRDNATPDPQAIAKQVKQQIDTDLALDSFGSQYPEIYADPYLADVADRFLAAEIETGVPFREALKKAGESTRDWVKQKAGIVEKPATPPTNRDEKRSRKESIDVIPSVHATATTSREPSQQPVSEVLDEMRKARGLTY